MDIAKTLRSSISHRIACIRRPTLNAFAGTGRSRKRELSSIHAIAGEIVDKGLNPYLFHWQIDNGEPASFTDVYLTVFTALFDIDDEDARRWTDGSELGIARTEAAREIAVALMRKFQVTKRVLIGENSQNPESRGFGDPVRFHNVRSRYDDDRGW